MSVVGLNIMQINGPVGLLCFVSVMFALVDIMSIAFIFLGPFYFHSSTAM